MIREIESADNPYIKEVKSLQQKKYRSILSKYMIEGVRFIFDAIDAGAEIESLIVYDKLLDLEGFHDLIDKANNAGIEIKSVSKKIVKELSDTVNPQGVIAVAKMAKRELIADSVKKYKNILILENIQDPGNLGTMIRTAAAADTGAVVLIKGCVDLYNPKTIRSTMSAIFTVPIFFAENPISALREIREAGFKIVGTSLESESNFFEYNFREKTAVVLGNEASGISEEIEALCDTTVKIPISNKIESLNVSQTAAIVLYEIVRQNLKK